MEAKDLMVGDFVRCKSIKEKYAKITEIYLTLDTDEPYYMVSINASGLRYCVPIEEVEPIPLTPEILQKNGWIYNDKDEKFFPQTWVGGGLMLQGAYDYGYCIVVTSDYDSEDTNNTPFIILYVHELQHALRLRRIKKEIVL